MTRKQTQTQKRKFLTEFARRGSVTGAALAAGITRLQHYSWLRDDKQYAEAFADAEDMAIEALEAEVRRRGHEGVIEPVFYQGKPVGGIRKYSDVLLMFLLKALRPDKYRENVNVNHSGEVNITERLRTGRERALQAAQERDKKETVN